MICVCGHTAEMHAACGCIQRVGSKLNRASFCACEAFVASPVQAPTIAVRGTILATLHAEVARLRSEAGRFQDAQASEARAELRRVHVAIGWVAKLPDGTLGPANDAPAVLEEIRAAEIALAVRVMSPIEAVGWEVHRAHQNGSDFDLPPTSPAWCGYLAREIYEHEDEP